MTNFFREVNNTASAVAKRLGSCNNVLFLIIQMVITLEFAFFLGYFVNKLFPDYHTDEDETVTYIYILVQSIVIVGLYYFLYFLQRLFYNLFNSSYKLTFESLTFIIVNIIYVIILVHTQRSYYKRIRFITKKEYCFLTHLLRII